MRSLLKKLLTPLRIMDLELRNRIVMTAMHLNFTPDGKVNDRIVAFYEERAEGGTGLIITGGCTINDVSGPTWLLDMRDDSCVEGHAVLADAIKKHGAGAACQLYHAGRYSHSAGMEGRQAVAPSVGVILAIVVRIGIRHSRRVSHAGIACFTGTGWICIRIPGAPGDRALIKPNHSFCSPVRAVPGCQN